MKSIDKANERWRSSGSDLASGGDGPHDPTMQARIAKLEAISENLQRDVGDLRADVREIRRDIAGIRTTDFRILFGAIIGVALGLAGLMAHGFHWI